MRTPSSDDSSSRPASYGLAFFVAGSRGSGPAMTSSRVTASRTVRAMGPAVSWVREMGTIPARLTRPTVGLMPTSPQAEEGEVIDPSVSVPMAAAQRLAATATADPELDPDGHRSRAYGFRVWPPRPLHPLVECVDRKFAHSLRFVFPRMMAPAARSFATTVESRCGCEPSSASDPAVHDILSAVSRLSFTRMGIPWSGPRSPFSLRSLSSASAIYSGSGVISRTALRVGPLRWISSIRARYASVSCREVKPPATSPSSMIRMVISSNGNGLDAGFACPGSVPCGKGRVPCARLPSAEDAAAARPAPRTLLRDQGMQNLLLIGGRLRPPRTPGGPRRGRRDPVWLDLPRRECLRKV